MSNKAKQMVAKETNLKTCRNGFLLCEATSNECLNTIKSNAPTKYKMRKIPKALAKLDHTFSGIDDDWSSINIFKNTTTETTDTKIKNQNLIFLSKVFSFV